MLFCWESDRSVNMAYVGHASMGLSLWAFRYGPLLDSGGVCSMGLRVVYGCRIRSNTWDHQAVRKSINANWLLLAWPI